MDDVVGLDLGFSLPDPDAVTAQLELGDNVLSSVTDQIRAHTMACIARAAGDLHAVRQCIIAETQAKMLDGFDGVDSVLRQIEQHQSYTDAGAVIPTDGRTDRIGSAADGSLFLGGGQVTAPTTGNGDLLTTQPVRCPDGSIAFSPPGGGEPFCPDRGGRMEFCPDGTLPLIQPDGSAICPETYKPPLDGTILPSPVQTDGGGGGGGGGGGNGCTPPKKGDKVHFVNHPVDSTYVWGDPVIEPRSGKLVGHVGDFIAGSPGLTSGGYLYGVQPYGTLNLGTPDCVGTGQPPPPPPDKCCPPAQLTCPPPPEDKVDHNWRGWQTCEGVCYVTGPGEAPRDGNDTLLAENPQMAQVLSAVKGVCGSICETPPVREPMQIVTPVTNPWNDFDACKAIEQIFQYDGPTDDLFLAKMFGFVDKNGNLIQPGKDKNEPFWLRPLDRFARMGFVGLLAGAGKLWNAVAGGDPCQGGFQTNADAKKAGLTWLERILGVDMSRHKNPITYGSNFACPHLLPDYKEATQAWLSGEIDHELFECWTRANGQLPQPRFAIARALRSKMTPNNLIDLWRREKIDDAQLDRRFRELGFILPSDYAEYRELAKLVPPYTDIIRMMVRDVEDPQVVGDEMLNTDFEKKYAGQLEIWGKSLGMPKELAQRLWQAHWDYPSAGQLYEFLHRLPPAHPVWRDRDPRAEVKKVLAINDMAPRWLDAFIDVSYRPLTRVDIRRMYATGVLDKPAVIEAGKQIGYDQPNAERLANFIERQTRLSVLSSSTVKLYLAGGLNRADAIGRLIGYGVRREDAEWSLDQALVTLRSQSRKLCTSAVRSRMMTGDVSGDQAVRLLIGLGLDADQSTILVDGWLCVLRTRSKQAQAGQLCKWFFLGMITAQEMFVRLGRLGWSQRDALLLVRECEQRLRVKLALEEKRRRKEEEAAERRRQKEIEKALRELEKQKDKECKRQTCQERLADEKLKKTGEASKALAGSLKLPESLAGLLVRDLIRDVQQNWMLGPLKSLRIVHRVIMDGVYGSEVDVRAAVSAAADAAKREQTATAENRKISDFSLDSLAAHE